MTGLHLVVDFLGALTLTLFVFGLVCVGWVEFRDRIITPRRHRYVPSRWVDDELRRRRRDHPSQDGGGR